MKRRNVHILPFVCELDSSARLNGTAERVAPSLEFLPDAMALEAEWRTSPAVTQQLEEDRAQQSSRVPSAIFLRQARFALVLRKLIQNKDVSHIHATTSRALVCALILKKLLGETVSATIEPRSELPREWIRNALCECVGGRLTNQKLVEQLGDAFFLDKTTFRSAPKRRWGESPKKLISISRQAPFLEAHGRSCFCAGTASSRNETDDAIFDPRTTRIDANEMTEIIYKKEATPLLAPASRYTTRRAAAFLNPSIKSA